MSRVKKYGIAGIVLLLPILAFAGSLGSTDVGMWLRNIREQLPQIHSLIIAVCYVTGIFMVTISVFKLKVYGQMTIYQSGNASASGPLMFMTIGIILLALPAMVDVMLYTMWGYGSENVPPYPSGNNWADTITPIIGIVQIIGYISFGRGWAMLAKMGTGGVQPGTFTKGVTHIIGGIVAINVMGTWQVLQQSVLG